MSGTLIVLLGPTGVGKTHVSLRLASSLHTHILSCDSRQFYRELQIGTAAPSKRELETVPHHFIGNLSIHDSYNAGQFEIDALKVIEEIFSSHDTALMVGGSMLYIDAVCKGIDDTPTIEPEIRNMLLNRLNEAGEDAIRNELKIVDPVYYNQVDLKNVKRILHGLEVFYMTGKPFSSFRLNQTKRRSFNILKIGLTLPREELYERINRRVDCMFENGLYEEALRFYPYKHLNALNTVGYKEIYEHLDGKYDFDFAKSMIKQNSRRYAKKQLSWFSKDADIHWFSPYEEENIVEFVLRNVK